MVNGGVYRQPTLIKHKDVPLGRRVISERTSKKLRKLLRLVVEDGTGGRADAPGYLVGGKTGTAEKTGTSGYRRRALISSFIGAFPVDDPQFVVFAMLDEPEGTEKTHGFATGGWVAAPVVGKLVRRIGPLAGIRPNEDELQSAGRDFAINRAPGKSTLASY